MNPLAIGFAALAMVAIGAVWFNSPLLFNHIWLAGIGKSAEQVQAEFTPFKPLASLIGSLVMATLLAAVMDELDMMSLVDGATIGLMAGIGFAAIPNGIRDYFEGRPRTLYLINAAHDIVILTAGGAIVGALG